MLPISKNPPSLWPEKESVKEVATSWLVAHLKPRMEKALARDLVLEGISYCCPFYTSVVRRRDNNKPRKSVLPVFPGYLAFADKEGASQFVYRTDRAVRILKVIDQKKLMDELDWILAASKDGRPFRQIAEYNFERGQTVRIKAGPMKGYEGEIVSIEGNKHILLSVEMFGQAIAVQIGPSDIAETR